MNIEEQKEIADELLGCLEIICPHAILAGGAPRDWYMENTANDLDFYISLPQGLQNSRLRKMIERILPEGVVETEDEFKSHQDPMYKHMKALENIYYYSYKGMAFQLIRLREVKDVHKAVDNMSCSICKAWYKNSNIGLTNDFKLTLKTGVMFLNDNYKWEDYHPKKMVERFGKSFKKGNKYQAETKLINSVFEGGVGGYL